MLRKTLFTVLIGLLALPVWAASAQSDDITYAGAFQPYENGFMLWEATSGNIWVLFADGTSRSFQEIQYATLPDNPVQIETPPGRYLPVRGFGRVWGHWLSVRQKIGWATAPEQSYTIHRSKFAWATDGAVAFQYSLPNGRSIILRNDNIWYYTDESTPQTITPTAVPPTPTPTATPAPGNATQRFAYQPFQNGFMLYEISDGDIWVYYADNQTVSHIPSWQYGNLNTPYRDVDTPDGLYTPILGFRRVWLSIDNVKTRLGWATAPETAYNVFVRSSNLPGGITWTAFALPDGSQIVQHTNNGKWMWLRIS